MSTYRRSVCSLREYDPRSFIVRKGTPPSDGFNNNGKWKVFELACVNESLCYVFVGEN